jgi:hypothetical protein
MIEKIDFSMLILQSKYKRKQISEKANVAYASLTRYANNQNMQLVSAISLLRFFGYVVPDDPIEYLLSAYNKVNRKSTIFEFCQVSPESFKCWKNRSAEPRLNTYIDFLNAIENAQPNTIEPTIFRKKDPLF